MKIQCRSILTYQHDTVILLSLIVKVEGQFLLLKNPGKFLEKYLIFAFKPLKVPGIFFSQICKNHATVTFTTDAPRREQLAIFVYT